MRKKRLESLTGISIAFLAVLTILSAVISYDASNCQQEVIFTQASNSITLFHALRYEIITGLVCTSDYVKHLYQGVSCDAPAGRLLNKFNNFTANYTIEINSKIVSCSKYNSWTIILNAFQVISSLVILYMSIKIFYKTKS